MRSSHLQSLRISLTTRPPCQLVFLLLLIALGFSLRFIFLNADPSYPEWIGYITDEGRWSIVARDMTLFGQHELTSLSSLHVAVAPLYQLFVWVFFEALGVDFWSARLFSAICGSILLILATRFLWRAGTTSTALLFAVVILALQPDLVFLSRVAIPEIAATLVHFLAFLVLLRDKSTVRSTALAGLITAAGVAMKATTMPIVFVFAAISAYCGVADQRQRVRHSLGFTLGVTAPGLLGLGAIIWFGGMQGFIGVVTAAAQFADISTLYGAVGFLFENRFVQPVNFLLLTAWCVGTLLYLKVMDYNSYLGRVYISSAIWVVGWITTASLMNYFPSRYFFPILIPLSIHLSAGLSLLSRKQTGESASVAVVTNSWIATVAFSLPIAVLLTPLLAGIFGELIPGAHRMRGHLALIIISAAMLSAIGRRIPVTSRVGMMATLFPILAAVGWFVAVIADALPPFFWDSSERQYMPIWITILVVAGLIAISASYRLETFHRLGPVIGGFMTMAMMLFFSMQLSRSYVDRHYTIRNASIGIGLTLEDAAHVLSDRAESMFLANRISISPANRISFSMVPSREKQTHIVTAFDNILPERLNGFSKTQSYSLYRHPDFDTFNPDIASDLALSEPTITIYRNGEPQN